jgi:hypothetical protein
MEQEGRPSTMERVAGAVLAASAHRWRSVAAGLTLLQTANVVLLATLAVLVLSATLLAGGTAVQGPAPTGAAPAGAAPVGLLLFAFGLLGCLVLVLLFAGLASCNRAPWDSGVRGAMSLALLLFVIGGVLLGLAIGLLLLAGLRDPLKPAPDAAALLPVVVLAGLGSLLLFVSQLLADRFLVGVAAYFRKRSLTNSCLWFFCGALMLNVSSGVLANSGQLFDKATAPIAQVVGLGLGAFVLMWRVAVLARVRTMIRQELKRVEFDAGGG